MVECVTPLKGTPLNVSVPSAGDKSPILPLDRRGQAIADLMIALGVNPLLAVSWDRLSRKVARYMIPSELFKEMIETTGCNTLETCEKLHALVDGYAPPPDGLYREVRERYKALL